MKIRQAMPTFALESGAFSGPVLGFAFKAVIHTPRAAVGDHS